MTIYRRGDKHCVSVYDSQMKKMRWIGSYASEDEAEAAEARACAGVTCDEYVDSWLLEHPRSEWTNSMYRRRVRPFAEAYAGVPLASLSADTIIPWTHVQTDGVFETTRTLLGDAIADGLHPGPNPLSRARPERSRKRLTGLDESALGRLVDCAIDAWGTYGYETFAPLIITVAYQRLMLAEVAGVRHEDVGDGTIVVCSRGARWEMTLAPESRAAIAQVPVRDGTPLLFTSKNGAPLSPCRIAYYWSPIRASFGSTSLKFDDLRAFRLDHPGPDMRFVGAV